MPRALVLAAVKCDEKAQARPKAGPARDVSLFPLGLLLE